ncbi:hypothetical protein PROFUN_12032 [Planoprotostelium fungivorum]|uniref:Uncharacterized protein n=1 Tax=Planoprotostelium fungivorum TaxID=1890364 RepID=A0A2P6MRF9_9EUKA|nr:hypothetical protein PROFUN_12032 [Planoprotostelium fungivorum]
MARQDRDKTSNFLSRQIQKLQDKTKTQIFMSLQVLNSNNKNDWNVIWQKIVTVTIIWTKQQKKKMNIFCNKCQKI